MGEARFRQPVRQASAGRQLIPVRAELPREQPQVLRPAEGAGRADRVVSRHQQAPHLRGVHRLGASAIRREVQQRHSPAALQLAEGRGHEHRAAVLEWPQARA